MKRVILAGAALAAAAFAGPALSETPEEATVWVGLSGSLDGFLVNEATGGLWMTGACLKALPSAQRDGSAWVSISREMASVGRMSTLVDQTFHIVTDEASPSIAIDNPSRGGLQALANVERVSCVGDACNGLKAISACSAG